MTRSASTRRLHVVSLIALAFLMTGCQEGSLFVPSDPATVRERIRSELDTYSNLHTTAIAAGVTVEVVRRTEGTACETGESLRFLMDWTSEVNHLTVALYQTAESHPLGSFGVATATCRVPGSSVAAPSSLPICPIVASLTTNEKPKALQHSTERADFSIVVSNNGPGNETIRWALQGVGRITRAC